MARKVGARQAAASSDTTRPIDPAKGCQEAVALLERSLDESDIELERLEALVVRLRAATEAPVPPPGAMVDIRDGADDVARQPMPTPQ
jgi:hypothetical protein